jgi:hypothetical protein
VLEEVQQVAVQGGGQARVVVVPVEDVERRRFFAQQVVVDEVAPDQVVGRIQANTLAMSRPSSTPFW